MGEAALNSYVISLSSAGVITSDNLDNFSADENTEFSLCFSKSDTEFEFFEKTTSTEEEEKSSSSFAETSLLLPTKDKKTNSFETPFCVSLPYHLGDNSNFLVGTPFCVSLPYHLGDNSNFPVGTP